MIAAIIITAVCGLMIGFALGVNLVRHNESMARKLLNKKTENCKLANEALFNVNQFITDVMVISSEKRVKESLSSVKNQIEVVRNNIV